MLKYSITSFGSRKLVTTNAGRLPGPRPRLLFVGAPSLVSMVSVIVVHPHSFRVGPPFVSLVLFFPEELGRLSETGCVSRSVGFRAARGIVPS